MRHLTAIAASAAAVALLASCGSGAGSVGPGSTPGTAASPASCHAQYKAWEHGPAKAAAKGLVAQLRGVVAAASAQDIVRLDAALRHIGKGAVATAAYPMPRCADPHGYWGQILTRLRSAADNASTSSGLGGLILAMAPLKEVPALEQKLSAELHQTVSVTSPLK
jgi:hypothetical protein